MLTVQKKIKILILIKEKEVLQTFAEIIKKKKEYSKTLHFM